MAGPPRIFDRSLLRMRRSRAAARMADAGFLHREVAARLLDRLHDIDRRHQRALVFGWDAPGLAVPADMVVHADLAAARLEARGGPRLVCDEEALPVRDGAVALILSNLMLHWVNDLPGALVQMRRALRPDGLFLGAMIGGESLMGLRHALMAAEERITGGVSPRLSPMVDIRDLGGLLQRSGFAMPVVDLETIDISYETPLSLLRDLSAMGEANALIDRAQGMLRREVLGEALRLYAERHRDPEGRVLARFDILFLAGWAPSDDQPKPKARGSASISLREALKDQR